MKSSFYPLFIILKYLKNKINKIIATVTVRAVFDEFKIIGNR